jgi:hypothetical protein
MREILTFSGDHDAARELDVNQIDPRDIAHSLANLCRLNGRSREKPPTKAEAV